MMQVKRAGFEARALAVAAVLVCCAFSPGRAAAALTATNWDAAQQRQVVRAGLMSNIGKAFGGGNAMSASETNAAMAALAARLAGAGAAGAPTAGAGSAPGVAGAPTPGAGTSVPPVHTRHSPVTVVTFDRMVIDQLGVGDVASHVQAVARAAGLLPPAYFGSEVVARFLGLRYTHPVGSEQLALYPSDPITRAEAAWSLDQIFGFGSWNVAASSQTLSAFELPHLTTGQLEALRIAVSRVGYPYVWGGTTDDTADGLVHGGFDCSGFAWRVFKLSGLPWGQEIQGRTAAQQAGEIPKRARLRSAQLQPGDLLFFGSAHFGSTATEKNIIHEGIYLGDNWVIHSSGQGVCVLPLNGSWLGESFAWGRRVIS